VAASSRPTVPPGTIVVYSDIGCPWASLTVHRLLTARDRLGLADAVSLDHRCFPLELINERATPKRVLDAEVAVIGSHEPALRWQPWQRRDSEYAVSTLLAMEAVQAAKADGVGALAASEQLDAALRHALYAEGATITLHTVVLEVAERCDRVDTEALSAALESGTARSAIFDQWRESQRIEVRGSPHLYLADGGAVHNPGVELSWTGEKGTGFPVIESEDRSVVDDLLRRAAART
jgi:predicted DsbA family dithiol-disulfide isomerase